MKWIQWKVAGVFFLLSACTHLSVTKDVLTSDFLLTKNTKQITFLGDNDHPRFSEDGKRLIYSSRSRASHKGWQVYEMDLENNKERRVTFSDGDAFDAIYISKSEILYASTTDEIKESPLLNKNFDKEFPPSDLYMSDLYGTNILRVTQQPGFDAQPFFVSHATRPSIFFTSRRGELSGIYRLDLKKVPVSLISAEKEKEKRFPAITPDRSQVAWAEKNLKTGEESLVLYNLKTKIPFMLKSNEGNYRDLFFSPRNPQRLFYSILRKGEKRYQIEVYDIDKQCTQVVFKGNDSLFSPAISNEETERVAFSRLFQDKKQIYIVNLPVDLGPCLEPAAQATLKE
ncbi:TolB family protein [Bdellovibrio bacteriovorus]|uniref:TolB family protein n=1 Tax=Bdellovibrio bacteriovorus TaxID=959 RepID=UPI0035A5BF41